MSQTFPYVLRVPRCASARSRVRKSVKNFSCVSTWPAFLSPDSRAERDVVPRVLTCDDSCVLASFGHG
eukprot:12892095-Prorocentrum_lima.AAC.1